MEIMEIKGVMDSALEYLRENIITCELKPGQKLNEIQLAKEFDISRPPLREALRILEREHLIINVPRKGCYVANISIADFEQVYEARQMNEYYSIDIFKQKNIKDVSKLAIVVERESNVDFSKWFTFTNKERLKYLKILLNFHLELVEIAGNNFITLFQQTIIHKLARYQFLYPYSPDSYQKSQNEHKMILEFLKRGEFDQAKEYLKTHLISFSRLLKEKMAQKNNIEKNL